MGAHQRTDFASTGEEVEIARLCGVVGCSESNIALFIYDSGAHRRHKSGNEVTNARPSLRPRAPWHVDLRFIPACRPSQRSGTALGRKPTVLLPASPGRCGRSLDWVAGRILYWSLDVLAALDSRCRAVKNDPIGESAGANRCRPTALPIPTYSASTPPLA